MKRTLFIVHRWLGIGLGAFMLLWFFSGLVMVYSGSTSVTRQERLAHSAPIPAERLGELLSAGEAWQRSKADRVQIDSERDNGASHSHGDRAKTPKPSVPGIHEARLWMLNGTPVWLQVNERGHRYAVSAVDGHVVRPTSDTALGIARSWGGASAAPGVLGVIERDLSTRMMMFDPYRPFIKVSLGDPARTELDVSSRTGEVVASTTLVQRVLAYTGEWLHYFRFLDSMGLGEHRRTILTWTSFVACIAVLTGLIIGWLRWRPSWFGGATYPKGRTQPYREPWPRWHFWSGLIGGLVALTWMVSGFLVNNPWDIFSKARFSQEEVIKFQGGGLPRQALFASPSSLIPAGKRVVEVSINSVSGSDFSLATDADGNSFHAGGQTQNQDIEGALLSGARRMVPGGEIVESVLLTEYDDYYYPNHRKHLADRPLPVYRIAFNDSKRHQLYIDPVEARPLLRIDDSRRAYRWLFYMLHNWDIGVLYTRPLWDVWMVTWSLIGLALSITSLWLGWRRLAKTGKRAKNSVQAPQALAKA